MVFFNSPSRWGVRNWYRGKQSLEIAVNSDSGSKQHFKYWCLEKDDRQKVLKLVTSYWFKCYRDGFWVKTTTGQRRTATSLSHWGGGVSLFFIANANYVSRTRRPGKGSLRECEHYLANAKALQPIHFANATVLSRMRWTCRPALNRIQNGILTKN